MSFLCTSAPSTTRELPVRWSGRLHRCHLHHHSHHHQQPDATRRARYPRRQQAPPGNQHKLSDEDVDAHSFSSPTKWEAMESPRTKIALSLPPWLPQLRSVCRNARSQSDQGSDVLDDSRHPGERRRHNPLQCATKTTRGEACTEHQWFPRRSLSIHISHPEGNETLMCWRREPCHPKRRHRCERGPTVHFDSLSTFLSFFSFVKTWRDLGHCLVLRYHCGCHCRLEMWLDRRMSR